MTHKIEIARRDLLKTGGSLVVAAGAARAFGLHLTGTAQAAVDPAAKSLAPDKLDTWLAISEDGGVTAYFGKMDMGQGVDTVIGQIVAEELDVAADQVTVVMGDTALTANQGGASASSACRQGADPLRNAAAEARRLLLERASARLGVPAGRLVVENGVVSAQNGGGQVSYGELVKDGGFGTQVSWNNKSGNAMNIEGGAKPKKPSEYRIVGTSVPRVDIPGKMLGTTEFCHHVAVEGMMHGRNVRPPVANAVPVKVDSGSIAAIPGARVVWRRDFLGVVADTEWGAIKAARQLKVEWSETEPPFPDMDTLFDYIRNGAVKAANGGSMFGGKKAYDVKPAEDGLAKSARVIEAEYEIPFQSHARMGPSMGLADVRADGVTVWSDTQKPHYTREGIAKVLGLPEEKVRVIWKPGPGSYGRSDADEAAFEAAIMSQHVGRPVRVQWMRDEGTGWDPKAPAAVITAKAGLDADGKVGAWYFRAKGFSGWDVKWTASDPEHTLAGMLLGHRKWDRHNFGTPEESYAFPNMVTFWETVAPFQEQASPLRCAHLRAPQEPQVHFAHEGFIDEVAAATGQDPIAFRLAHLKDEREIAVLKKVAEAADWESRPSPAGDAKSDGEIVRGRGVALTHGYGSYVATVCEVEVNRRTGRVWPRRFVVAHDCGIVLNPLGLRGTIEGNVIQGTSRALWEEVQFDRNGVTSVDWATYPILDAMDAPEAIDIATIDRRDEPAGGAGEPTLVTIPAVIANAVFDATGVRIRRLPMTPERIKAALG